MLFVVTCFPGYFAMTSIEEEMSQKPSDNIDKAVSTVHDNVVCFCI